MSCVTIFEIKTSFGTLPLSFSAVGSNLSTKEKQRLKLSLHGS